MSAVLALCVFLCASLGTWAVRQYALARGVIDSPNSRSSHKVPTPRGGGVAIVVAFLGAVALLALGNAIAPRTALALLAAGALTAAVGFWDDHAPLSARWRLATHFMAAGGGLTLLGGMTAPTVLGWSPGQPLLVQAFAVVGLVWLLNLYNFMDGIDGIAGIEAVTLCIGGGAVALVTGNPTNALLCLLLGAAAAGFLVWNFPPAKIFMGDAGSGFLGLVFGLLAIDASRDAPALLWSWLILLGVFITDASLTLLRRLLRGERVYQAHRTHAYQHAARKCGAHLPVTLVVATINMLWLAPLALAAASGWLRPGVAVVLAYAPLILLAVRLRAGQPEENPVS